MAVEEYSDCPLHSYANPKRLRDETPMKAHTGISSTQYPNLWKKISTAKIIQEMAKSLKILTTENASLRVKIKNTRQARRINLKKMKLISLTALSIMIILAYRHQKSIITCRRSNASGDAGIGLPRKGFQRKLSHITREIVIEKAKALKVCSIPRVTLLQLRNMMINLLCHTNWTIMINIYHSPRKSRKNRS